MLQNVSLLLYYGEGKLANDLAFTVTSVVRYYSYLCYGKKKNLALSIYDLCLKSFCVLFP